MHEAKHTPGPLTPTRDPKTGDVGLLDDHRHVVAECYAAIRSSDERADDEAMANARLFSTAQELLSLLQDAVASFGPHLEGGDDEWLQFARAAIAKATGSIA